MNAPQIPEDEALRRRSLYELDILDSGTEEAYDRVTRTAARLFEVPIALVSLVDANRQWFKSRCGLEACETRRDISFCGHTILSETPLVVEDASRDLRFSDNPLVIGEPSIRFYAGQPLETPDGSRIGTLCLIDRKPREFGSEELLALKDLGGIIENLLAIRLQTTRDELTGISNRRGFHCLARKYLNASSRSALPMSLIYFDLDNFTAINENHGRAAGDRALQLFATAMEDTFRKADVLGRLGGDEFVALMWNAMPTYANVALQRFREALAEMSELENTDFDIDFSAGIVPMTHGQPGEIERLIEAASRLRYQEKRQRAAG
jgi:diguanylate cyclase (GGDEF)-like protein